MKLSSWPAACALLLLFSCVKENEIVDVSETQIDPPPPEVIVEEEPENESEPLISYLHTISDDGSKEFEFTYEYDERGRIISSSIGPVPRAQAYSVFGYTGDKLTSYISYGDPRRSPLLIDTILVVDKPDTLSFYQYRPLRNNPGTNMDTSIRHHFYHNGVHTGYTAYLRNVKLPEGYVETNILNDTWEYDERGNATKSTSVESGTYSVVQHAVFAEYDTLVNPFRSKHRSNDLFIGQGVYPLPGKNNLLTQISPDYGTITTHEYTYNEKGLPVRIRSGNEYAMFTCIIRYVGE